MGLTKHGTGEIIPEPGDEATAKVAKKEWTEEDEAALAAENET